MRPLPEAPTFPVYGLGEHFDGFRWLTLWQSPRALYLIDLGHGRPEAGPWISVQTVAKSPYVALTADSGVGPTGLEDAVTHAAIRLAELSSHDRDEAKRLIDDECARFDYDASQNRLRLLEGWLAAEVTIDAVTHPASFRQLNAAWAVVVDLTEVAVVVTGPTSQKMGQVQRANVSERIDQYM
jgi:hypothetical protein